MTPLPTRETDGGIDWEKIAVDPCGLVFWGVGDQVICLFPLDFAQLVAAHERERCAKVAEGYCTDAGDSMAAHFRKLEP